MRVVVFSDSHGSFQPLYDIVEAQPGADLFIHLGDGLREFDDLRSLYPEKRLLAVRGNCDWTGDAKTEAVVGIGGVRIFFAHGHTLSVKRGAKTLLAHAKRHGAGIACFGHTHCAHSSFVEGIYLLNPGSVSLPRCGGGPSYAVIDIRGAQISTGIKKL